MPENPPTVEGAAEELSPATPVSESANAVPTNGRSADRTIAVEEHLAGPVQQKGGKRARKEAKRAAKDEKKAKKLEKKARAKANEKTAASVVKKSSGSEKKRKKARLRFESKMDREELATYLEAIAKGLRKGGIQFRQGETSLTLSPPARVGADVKVSYEKGREKVAVEVEWSTDDPQQLSIVAG